MYWVLIRIDPGSDRPIYGQIATAIENQIAAGGLAAGERLPSARALSASLGVNMHTVLKAYSRLQDDSLVEMRRGRAGVVVSDRPDVERMARRMVGAAKTSGMSRAALIDLITEAWR